MRNAGLASGVIILMRDGKVYPLDGGPMMLRPNMILGYKDDSARDNQNVMASINSFGGKPKFSLCFTIIMNFMVTSPFLFELGADFPAFEAAGGILALLPGSIEASNE